MPRSHKDDYLMINKFHIYDVSLTLPPVLFPSFGFSSITAPELGLEYEEIKEGNFEFPRKVFKSANVKSVVMSNGAKLQDNDFYSWATQYIEGHRDKKNLLLVQFTNIDDNIFQDILGFGLGLVTSGDNGNYRVPARAWVLREASPKHYIPTSGFDANSSEISIQSLEVEYEHFVEINMG